MRHILVNKKVPHEVSRPLVHDVIFYILGIIGGNILLSRQSVSFFFWIGILSMALLFYGIYYNTKSMLKCLGYVIIGFILFWKQPIHQEMNYFTPHVSYQMKGQIETVKVTDYYKWVTLKDVEDTRSQEKLKSKVQIRMPLAYHVSTYDEIMVHAMCMEIEPQMNPSDLDYAFYLRGQKIVATFKLEQLVAYKVHTPCIEQIRDWIREQLESLFSEEKVGVMEAVILGDDTRLDPQIEDLYQVAGISHVLCISGFHVGVVIGALLTLVQFIPLSYTKKHVLLLIAVMFYTILTGYATSTVRAAIMVSVGLLGKCLWQEDDGITNVAIAALLILSMNPYQLFMVGFQLSFGAVVGVILCSCEIEKKELYVEWCYTSWQRTLLIWSSVQLLTWPIIAYHFFEIPFIASLFNLIIIPLFSIIIVMGWWLLALSFIPIPIANIGSWLIEVILDAITKVVSWLVNLPFASLCTGRPSLLEYTLYFGGILLIGLVIWGYCKKEILYQGFVIIGCCYSLSLFLQPKNLKITSLYVGQGDCSVIEIPQHGLFIIDGGNFGNGETIEKYIKYLGYDEIQGIMVSHSDSDHIGGVLELLEEPIPIEQVFISQVDSSSNLQMLLLQCEKEKIPIYSLSSGDRFQYGKLQIECIAPQQDCMMADNNENSIVCKLGYDKFSALFTGDQSKETIENLYRMYDEITLLKVSHHGSRTGTSQELLLKLQPKYAMISCGRNNRYGHPHGEVVTLLEEANVEVSRTDQEGAIYYETDGEYIKKTSHRKDA